MLKLAEVISHEPTDATAQNYKVALKIDGQTREIIVPTRRRTIEYRLGLPTEDVLCAVLKLCIAEMFQKRSLSPAIYERMMGLEMSTMPRVTVVNTDGPTGFSLQPAPAQDIYKYIKASCSESVPS